MKQDETKEAQNRGEERGGEERGGEGLVRKRGEWKEVEYYYAYNTKEGRGELFYTFLPSHKAAIFSFTEESFKTHLQNLLLQFPLQNKNNSSNVMCVEGEGLEMASCDKVFLQALLNSLHLSILHSFQSQPNHKENKEKEKAKKQYLHLLQILSKQIQVGDFELSVLKPPNQPRILFKAFLSNFFPSH